MKTKTIFIFALLLSSVGATFSQSGPAAAASAVKEFDVGGMKVLFKRRTGTPTVAAGLFIRGGVRNMTAENAGIEGFTLNAAIEGGKSYPRQRLRKETSRVATLISAGANYDYSTLSLVCTRDNFENSWRAFTDVAINPEFASESIEQVRSNILTALRNESDSPEGSLELLNKRTIFAGHPYLNGPEGTIENVTRFKAADLMAYHRGLMQTSRLLLVIVGDLDPVALEKQVTTSFSSVLRGTYQESALPSIAFIKPTVDIMQKDVKTDYVKGVFAAPSMREPDYYAMRAAMTLLQTAVFQEVRVKRNLSYAPDASLDERSANTASISVTSVNPNEAISVMLNEINKLKQFALPEEDIANMAGYYLTTHYLKQETNAAQASELAQYELIGGGWRNSLEFLDRLRKVKPADIQAAANKYMKNVRFVVVGNPADVDRSIFLRTE